MIELSLREIQLVELDVLKKFASICEEENLIYSLTFGTLLGAIRHKGFIPWDDDVDVMMPREDYERFLSYCQNNADSLGKYKLIHYTTNKRYIYPIARFCDTEYYIDYDNTKDYGLGLFIDIYPFDGCGNNIREAEKWMQKLKPYKIFTGLSGAKTVSRYSNGFTNYIRNGLAMFYAKIIGDRHWIKKLDKMSKTKNLQKYKLTACTIWQINNNFYDSSIFSDIVKLQFEDTEFCSIKDFKKFLQINYDDYMQLPPPEKRINQHYYRAYRK